MSSGTCSSNAAICSGGASTNNPTVVTNGGKAATMSAA